MTTESSLLMKLTPHVVMEQVRVHGWNWRTGAAVCGLCFGIISPIIGSIFTAIAWFTGPLWHGFSIQRDGAVLLFLTIPLLLFGSHCLDLMDKHDKKRRAKARRNRVETKCLLAGRLAAAGDGGRITPHPFP